MKKFLSIALAVCMVFSLGTVAFADGGYSTTVSYSGTGSCEWELSVPVNMAPGGLGEVVLEGTWDAATVFDVKSDDLVVMGNDIDYDTKSLAITFDGINQVGNNYGAIEVVKSIEVADLTGVIFGNWRGVFNYYLTVNKAEIAEELEQDAEGNLLINDADDLFLFAKLVNDKLYMEEDISVLLTDDIDLKNVPFTPIGYRTAQGINNEASFRGTFDGQGHTIYNLNVATLDGDSSISCAAGLFGYIGRINFNSYKTVIKNLKIDGANISSTHFAGAIAGFTGNWAEIIDCEVRNATITSTYYNDDNSGDKAGTIIGTLNSDSIIKNCHAYDSTVTASRDAGQLVGSSKGDSVVDCSATNVEVKWNGVGTGANIRNEVIGRLIG